jgi:hypothetical protein
MPCINKRGKVYLAHSFRGANPSWQGGYGGVAHIMVVRKYRKRKESGTSQNLQRHTPSDLLLLPRPYLLKFLPPPKIVPSTGNQAFTI